MAKHGDFEGEATSEEGDKERALQRNEHWVQGPTDFSLAQHVRLNIEFLRRFKKFSCSWTAGQWALHLEWDNVLFYMTLIAGSLHFKVTTRWRTSGTENQAREKEAVDMTEKGLVKSITIHESGDHLPDVHAVPIYL